MQGRRYWVEHGKIGPIEAPSTAHGPVDERAKFESGQVRLTTGELGTEVKWTVLSPCTASLFATTLWLQSAKPPFILRFYACGWFEEVYEESTQASQRIENVIAKGDRHFTCHTLVKTFSIDKAPISPFLSECINGSADINEFGVECVFEKSSQQFHVEKVGAKSPIGRAYGTFLSSFACRAEGSYSDVVSIAYAEVLQTGRPRYDQVLAAMQMPNKEIRWVPYSRLLLPLTNRMEKQSVMVISEVGRVDIQLI
jgi:hypothetical protein